MTSEQKRDDKPDVCLICQKPDAKRFVWEDVAIYLHLACLPTGQTPSSSSTATPHSGWIYHLTKTIAKIPYRDSTANRTKRYIAEIMGHSTAKKRVASPPIATAFKWDPSSYAYAVVFDALAVSTSPLKTKLAGKEYVDAADNTLRGALLYILLGLGFMHGATANPNILVSDVPTWYSGQIKCNSPVVELYAWIKLVSDLIGYNTHGILNQFEKAYPQSPPAALVTDCNKQRGLISCVRNLCALLHAVCPVLVINGKSTDTDDSAYDVTAISRGLHCQDLMLHLVDRFFHDVCSSTPSATIAANGYAALAAPWWELACLSEHIMTLMKSDKAATHIGLISYIMYISTAMSARYNNKPGLYAWCLTKANEYDQVSKRDVVSSAQLATQNDYTEFVKSQPTHKVEDTEAIDISTFIRDIPQLKFL